MITQEEREEFYNDLIAIVARLQRSYERVFPWMVALHLPFYRCEQTLRKDMAYLARRGDLIRVGGFKARRGYSAPARRHRTAA